MDEISPISPLKELDIFEARPIQNSVLGTYVTEYRPISILKSDSQIQFVINSSEDEYVLLNDMLFYMRIRIDVEKTGDVAEADWDKLSTENYLLHSLFKQVNIEINGKQLTTAPNTYAHRAYIEALLGYTYDAKNSHMTGALYTKEASDVESVNGTRTKYIKPTTISKDGNGKELDLIDKLKIDLAQQAKALIGGLEIKISLTPNAPEFYMHEATNAGINPKVNFLEAALFVRKIKVSQHIVDAHRRALKKSPALYPINRNEVKSFTINTGTLSTSIDNIVFGQLPRRAFVAFVSNAALNGDYTKNPFNFKDFSLSYICMHLDGRQIPNKAYTPDYTNNKYIREYIGLFDALNQLSTDSIFDVNRDKYIKGKIIYGFNLTDDYSDGLNQSGHINKTKKGNLRLDVKFNTALTETVSCLIFLEFDNLIKIDMDGKVTTDFI